MFKSKIYSREDLKKHFRNGEIPTENHFSNLIDSMLNKQDDGFSKDDENGLIIASRGSSTKFVTLYKNIDDLNPFFYVEKDEREIAGLRFTLSRDNDEEKDDEKDEQNSFFFHVNGSVGIGTRSKEEYKLQVNGFVGLEGRVGTYLQGQVPSDGNWHSIIEGLDNCQAFEIIARTGIKGSGKFAILHAYALSAFGRSHSRIRRVCARYGSFWNRIVLRWKSKGTHDYALQIRTSRNYGKDVYGKDVYIYYKVSKLWDDEKFLPEEYYH